MADGSAIEWTDATWNPTVGCSLESPGCTNCYAMRQAARLARMGQQRYAGLTQDTKAGPVWTGEVRAAPDDTIHTPLRWARPRRIFVNSMSDLFHPRVRFGQVMRVWQVMGRCPQHNFQILTKRPDRMRLFLELWGDLTDEREEPQMVRGPARTRAAHPSGRGQLFAAMLDAMGDAPPGAAHPTFDWMDGMRWWPSVLSNVWLGTSAEDQLRLEARSGPMQAIADMGWSTWCSAEPLLGPLDLAGCRGWLRWLVAGGESGPRARPMHPDWARSLRDQCRAAKVPFFFKQWGEWKPISEMPEAEYDKLYKPGPDTFPEAPRRCRVETISLGYGGATGNDAFLPVNGHPGYMLFKVGKRCAGNLLDGELHQAFPA